MTNANPSTECSRRLAAREAAVKRLERRHFWIGNSRIGVFVAIATVWWQIGWHNRHWGYWLAGLVVLFAALIVIHIQVERRAAAGRRAAAFYRRALERIEDRWMGSGDNGLQFHSDDHVYAGDLDILGDGSLYQLLCSARTRMGKQQLAQWLLAQNELPEIRLRQEAVRELSDKLDLREALAVAGNSDQVDADPARLAQWGKREITLRYERWWPWVAALAVVGTGSVIYGFAAATLRPPLYALLVNALVTFAFRGPLQVVFADLTAACRNLEGVAAMLKLIEAEKFSSPRLLELQQRLTTSGLPAWKCIEKLNTLSDLEESRRNMFMQLFDLPLMYSVQVGFALKRWRRKYGGDIEVWLNVVGEFEALASLAAYAYEHPADPFPELVAPGRPGEPAVMEGEKLGHPLLPDAQCVRNSVALSGAIQVWLVSGSNMSGKSTFLRTTGINAVLAMAGAPVRATRLRMTPVVVGASMRISDSLRKGVSHFYAEISRIRDVVALSQRGGLLFLLDEVLQGTNSHDRRVGAEGILRTLLLHGAIGLITTHDLALTSIAEVFPGRIKNVHFQEKLEAGKLSFDYQLREGVVTTSNGLELMKSVGLEV